MKRLKLFKIIILVLLAGFLFSACAPSRAMIATLTQLPITVTPTRQPTFTPRPPTPGPSPTASITPTGGAVLTPDFLTPAVEAPSTGTPSPTPSAGGASNAGACPPFSYDRTVPSPDKPQAYIGLHFDPFDLPTGVTLAGSGALGSPDYAWYHVQVLDRDMYWIQKLVCRDASGQAYWEIADAITLPVLNAQANEVPVDLCFQGGQQLSNVIAYGTVDPSQPVKKVAGNVTGREVKIINAWLMQKRFAPLNPASLTCVQQAQ